VLEPLLDRHRVADQLEAADRVAVLDQLVLVQREVVEVLPPLWPRLAAVVLEQLREQPLRRALRRVAQELQPHPLALVNVLPRLLARLPTLRRWAPRQVGGPPLDQP